MRNFNEENFVNRLKSNCALTEIKQFQANEIITTFLTTRNQFCILLEGEAQLLTYDKDGNRKILYYYKKNDVFGEPLFRVYMDRELFVIAKEPCKVLFYPHDIAENCTKDCMYHIELLKNLPELIYSSIAKQNFRMLLITNKSVRDKLLTYFQILSSEAHSKSFELPLSLTDMSDYLMIERTAMMRELKRLKDEKIIKKVKNRITLL